MPAISAAIPEATLGGLACDRVGPLALQSKVDLAVLLSCGRQEEREGKEGRRAWLRELAGQQQRTCQPRPAGPAQDATRITGLAGSSAAQGNASLSHTHPKMQATAPQQQRWCRRPCRSCQARSSPPAPCPAASRGGMVLVEQARRGWAAEDAALHIGSAVPTCRPTNAQQAHTPPPLTARSQV